MVANQTDIQIVNATADTDGSYTCVADWQSDGEDFVGGQVTSDPATLTVYRKCHRNCL